MLFFLYCIGYWGNWVCNTSASVARNVSRSFSWVAFFHTTSSLPYWAVLGSFCCSIRLLHGTPCPPQLDLTFCVEQSPSWEANRFSASQEIPLFLWNLKFHYSIYKCLPPVCILSQLDPVHPTSWRSILILSSRLCLASGLSSSFPTKVLYAPLFPPHMLHAPTISFFLIWWMPE